MERRMLEKTPYLLGLEELFKRFNVKTAYSYHIFSGTKDDGVVISIPEITVEEGNIVSAYMDDDSEALLEQRSGCLSSFGRAPDSAYVIYNDGVSIQERRTKQCVNSYH